VQQGLPARHAAGGSLCLQAHAGPRRDAQQPAAQFSEAVEAPIAEALETHSPEIMDTQPERFSAALR
jgi:hypothetical protein